MCLESLVDAGISSNRVQTVKTAGMIIHACMCMALFDTLKLRAIASN